MVEFNISGYVGRSVCINLSTNEILQKKVIPEQTLPYIGGRGIGIKLLHDITSAGIDPFSPENPLIFATGPYTGTGIFSAMFNVTTKSPLTGVAASSHCGGHWGPKLKKAGFDSLIITGVAKTPCYLLIDEGKVTIKDAKEIWGCGVFATEEFIRRQHGEVEVLCIGQAGENLIRFAAIMNGHRALGRSGVGAVMGHKKLKAIAVKGSLPIKIQDSKKLAEISRNGSKSALEKGATFAKYGTPLAFSFFNEKHVLPTRYFREGYFEDADKIDAYALKNKYFVADIGCYKCPLKCSKIHAVEDGPYKLTEKVEGPEYETLMALGSGCGNANIESILMANYLCNDFGIDTISCGNIFGLLMDLSDLRIIGPSQLDGMTFKWGDHATMIAMIPKIAHRQGIGNLLADGSWAAANYWGGKSS